MATPSLRVATEFGCALAKFCVEGVGAFVEGVERGDVEKLVAKN